MIDKAIIDEINNSANIVTIISNYLNVTKKGKYFFALCPFHNDTHPSLQIDPERNTFHCWVDGHYGNSFSFIMQYENVGFVEAVKKVANIIGFKNLQLENFKKNNNSSLKPLFDCINDLNLYYEYCLSQYVFRNENLKKYLNDRQITNDIIKKFHLGYAIKNSEMTINFLKDKGHSIRTIDEIGFLNFNDKNGTSFDINQGRLIFPIFDSNDQVVGFSARIIIEKKEDVKYLNSRETKIFIKKKIFYNLNNAKKTIKYDNYVYLLEGFMDVIALYKIGINSAIAIMGTNLSNEHVQILKKMNVNVYLCFDNDLAGQIATIKAISLLRKVNINVKVVNYIDNTNFDIDEILRIKGPEILKENLKNLVTDFEFEVSFYKQKLKNKNKIIEKFKPFFLEKYGSDSFEEYIEKFSNILEISPFLIKRKIDFFLYNTCNIIKKNANFSISYKNNSSIENIEKIILHYMFYYHEAIEFYMKKIDHFYTRTFDKIANYIVDNYLYNKQNNKQMSNLDNLILKDLITSIENAFYRKKISVETKKIFDSLMINENNANYRGKVIYPKFDENSLLECEKLLKKERNKIDEEKLFERILETKSDEEIANFCDQRSKDILK